MQPQNLNDAEVLQLALQQRYQSSLFQTAKYLCGYSQVNEYTHGSTIRALENSDTRKLIVMPRGTFKTSIAVVAFPIWLMIRNPNIRILLDSEVWTLSKNSLREIKSHLKGDRFRDAFPNWKPVLDNQDEMIINTRSVPKKEPTITASGIGAGKTGQHYDVIIADDLNSPKNSMKPELAEQVINHYRYYTSILDPGGTIVIIGTRYSELDLIAWIMKNEMGMGDQSTVSKEHHKQVYLLVGCPGVGKTWVSDQLKTQFNVLEHDEFKEEGYYKAIADAARHGDKPVLANTPFGVSRLTTNIESLGPSVIPVFIIEEDEVVTQRYESRSGKKILPGHLTRQRTYLRRARDLGAFVGTSSEVLEHLKRV